MNTSTTIAIISLLISGFSTLIAILSYYRNRSELILFGKGSASSPTPIIAGEITIEDPSGKKESLPDGLLVHMQFLNPSPNDIAYFNFHFEMNGRIVEAVTQKSYSWFTDRPRFVLHDLLHTAEISFFKEPQGKFPANSLTPIYAFMPLEMSPIPDQVSFVICYAIRRFPYFGKNRRFSTLTMKLDLNDFETLIKSMKQTMKLLSSSKPQSLESSEAASSQKESHK
ncbi:hypothetical protein [Loigolactobacillus coryniformis]|uniref:hypothetical protein n=1 Tax=Loigolactobacillus coryniformis TaxID=1610 RepID=UPI0003146B6E|nr:hypothetical protein [Loigolactobacillus coryniformis]